MASRDRRVQLVGGRNRPETEAGLVGAGLLVGLVAGHRALLGAATGRIAFELGLAWFVAAVLVSVGGSLALGALYDRFTADQREVATDDETPSSEGSQHDADGDAMGNPADPSEDHGPADPGQ